MNKARDQNAALLQFFLSAFQILAQKDTDLLLFDGVALVIKKKNAASNFSGLNMNFSIEDLLHTEKNYNSTVLA